MEFPLNEQNQYPLIKQSVIKIFASRAKPISEKTVEVWVTEILARNFTDEAIEKATQMYVENEEYNLVLPVFLRLAKENTRPDLQHNAECVFCEGRGTVGATLAFELDGTLMDYQFVLNCYCNKDGKLTQMIHNPKTFNKTMGNNKYFRVFKDICEREKYLQKVCRNGYKDINA